jgi:hypothetical protein
MFNETTLGDDSTALLNESRLHETKYYILHLITTRDESIAVLNIPFRIHETMAWIQFNKGCHKFSAFTEALTWNIGIKMECSMTYNTYCNSLKKSCVFADVCVIRFEPCPLK